MISKTAEYAVRAMVVLEGRPGPMVVRDIAEAADVPRSYLSKVLHTLARAGFVEGGRGPRGGFVLGKANEPITAYDVVSRFDDLSRGQHCFLGREDCRVGDTCGACERWLDVWRVYEQFLRETDLQSMASHCMRHLPTRSRAEKRHAS